jgi:thermitase
MKKAFWGTFVLSLLFCNVAFSQLSGPQAVSGEYIIKFKKKTGLSGGLKVVNKLGASVSVKGLFGTGGMMHVKVNSEAAKNSLYANPDVEFIEPNFILSVNPTEQTAFGSAPESSDQYIQSGTDSRVRVTDSWGIQKPYNQGSKVLVAVIDTGLDTNHGLFRDSNALWANPAELNGSAGVDDDGNGYIDDVNGWNFDAGNGNVYDDNDHGTHVAGIILGVGQDVSQDPVRESKIKIMPLKFLDANGSGVTSSAISAIYYAVSKGAKVINNSWGGSGYSQSLHEAYTFAHNNGVVIVSAAGNSSSNNDSISMYPANFDSPNNISVAASDEYSDSKASFSNYGAKKVDVAAPGVRIISSVPGDGCLAPGCFMMMSGTSMAAPFVAGMAALILREAPQLSSYQVKSIIISSVDYVSSLSSQVSSRGRVNVYKAIQGAISNSAAVTWNPSYSPSYSANRSFASETGGTASPAGCGLVSALVSGSGGGSGGLGGAEFVDLFLVFSVLLLPLIVAVNFRMRAAKQLSKTEKRAYSRFAISKHARLRFGDKIIEITTDDISVGGISFSADIGLYKGQFVEVDFGDGFPNLNAEVVRCSETKRFGLKFVDSSEETKNRIELWTAGLVPTD